MLGHCLQPGICAHRCCGYANVNKFLAQDELVNQVIGCSESLGWAHMYLWGLAT